MCHKTFLNSSYSHACAHRYAYEGNMMRENPAVIKRRNHYAGVHVAGGEGERSEHVGWAWGGWLCVWVWGIKFTPPTHTEAKES
jgi:hypothetical protein